MRNAEHPFANGAQLTEPAKQYLGVIDLGRIENIGDGSNGAGLLTARFVHYPECQQLIVWLPSYGRDGYGGFRVIDIQANSCLISGSVDEILNGSVQLLFDTLSWPPGDFVLEIEGPHAVLHVLHFRKLHEGEILPTAVEPIVQEAESASSNLWRVYRDGWGNPIPNGDAELRAQASEQLSKQFGDLFRESQPIVECHGNARAGDVIYVEGPLRLAFWYEMGSGACKIYINVPSVEHWEAATGTPVARRCDILEHIARSFKRDCGPAWRYEIRDSEIAFF